MSIKSSLKNLVIAFGGTPTAKTIPGLLDELTIAKDPLFGLTVDFDIAADTDLLGKVIGDLQSDVYVKNGNIYGKLAYQDDYTSFSGDPDLQVGHYVAMHIYVPGDDYEYADGVRITVSRKGRNDVTLDDDGILILRAEDTVTPITFTASKSGLGSASKTFKLSGLTLLPAEDDE